MARHNIIADSEDEDEIDDASSPHAGDLGRPEPEPLSPHGQPSSPARERDSQPSDVTDPSFFAKVYDGQQDLAAQQSNLIENIVRQSQRLSASSGHVSLPAKKTGRRVNPSSGTDVTSPMVSSRPRNQAVVFNDDVSEITTPRKSMGREWEIPSSPEDAAALHRTEHAMIKERTRGRTKRGRPTQALSPAAAAAAAASPPPSDRFTAEETRQKARFEDIGVDDELNGGSETNLTPLPVAKRAKLSHHDPILAETQFYIAQSNLTTMQKLQYQKVNVSTSGYGSLPGTLPNQKSSGATTVAYSTPNGYSSIPPLPGEESPGRPASPQRNVVINISSSPDANGTGFDLAKDVDPVSVLEIETHLPDNSGSLLKTQSRPSIGERKKKAMPDAEEDELCRNDNWDPDDRDVHQESRRSRAMRRSVVAAGFSGIESSTKDTSSETAIQIQGVSDSPITPELQPEILPKKRGRKKKQLAPEHPLTATETNEDSNPNRKPHSPSKTTESESPLEKPKKKRGRPRKSGPSKAAQEPAPEPQAADELPATAPPPNDDKQDESAEITGEPEDIDQDSGIRNKTIDEIDDAESQDDRTPLQEKDSNPKTLSKPVSTVEPHSKTTAESRGDQCTPKAQLRETPKLAASQSKVTYRVGLSKRSRIAPLLKSIRK